MVLRRVFGTAFVALAAGQSAFGQLPIGPNDPFVPFRIAAGTTFSASRDESEHGRNAIPDHKLSPTARQLRELERIVRQHHVSAGKIDTEKLYSNALNESLRQLDPHSRFYTRSEWSDLIDEQRSSYVGIGVTMADIQRDGRSSTYVLATFNGSPAAVAGLRFGDRVTAVNGVTVVGKTGDIIRDMIRGPQGTRVKLTVERAPDDRQVQIELRRGRVAQTSIADSYLISGSIGYIDLTDGFAETTASEFITAATALKRSGATSFVIDLRGNGGGIVDQAVKIAEYFLPRGTPILTQRGRIGDENREWRSGNRSHDRSPVVLLVDENTASASEILAGALQDNDRALVVGTKTFGKGLVQSVLALDNGVGITLTTARFFTPSGRSLQRDYSTVGRYDYYEHRTGEKSSAVGSYVETRTTKNRRVTGGDGITPDIISTESGGRSTSLATSEKAFQIVRDSVRSATASLPNVEVIKPAVSPPFALLTDTGLSTLDREIAYFKALSVSNVAAGRRTLIMSDPTVRRAVNSLPEARSLIASNRGQ